MTLVSVMLSPPLYGADRTITVMANRTCKTWIDDRAKREAVDRSIYDWFPAATSEHWLLGLLTGLNAGTDIDVNLLNDVDSQLVFDWMDKYCKEHPDQDVYNGAEELVLDLVKMKIREECLRRAASAGKTCKTN